MRLSLVLAGLAALLPRPAHANGQTTHLWISMHALEHLPPGELHDLLVDHLVMLRNGTMFPDGGYAVDDDYGERSHWEPFQGLYLDWILAEHPAPFTDEGAEHVAFLMGLASHGMADQTFDALYVTRAQVYDEGLQDGGWNFDMAQDVILASREGAQEVPEEWAPYQTLSQLFAEGQGYEVSEETMADGMQLLEIAVVWVGNAGQQESLVTGYEAEYPWGAAHILDPAIPGSPPCEGELVARYWLEHWNRLQEVEAWDTPVMSTFPPEGGTVPGTAAGDVEARVSLVFSRSVQAAPQSGAGLSVVDESGAEVEVDSWFYYGDGTNVLHLAPVEGWAEDTDYTVTIDAGLADIHGGITTEPITTSFTTRPPPAAEPLPADESGCTTVLAPAGLSWCLGLLAIARRRR